jgi:hypothetical protein
MKTVPKLTEKQLFKKIKQIQVSMPEITPRIKRCKRCCMLVNIIFIGDNGVCMACEKKNKLYK